MVTLRIQVPTKLFLEEFIVGTGLVKSMTEAKRLLNDGAIEIGGKVIGPETTILLTEQLQSKEEMDKRLEQLMVGYEVAEQRDDYLELARKENKKENRMKCPSCGTLMQRLRCGGPTFCQHTLLTLPCPECWADKPYKWGCLVCEYEIEGVK